MRKNAGFILRGLVRLARRGELLIAGGSARIRKTFARNAGRVSRLIK